MKATIQKLGDRITAIGEKRGIRWMIYNPITWARFLSDSRRGGRVFSQIVREEFPRVRTCLDVGSGAGGYVFWLKRRGLQAVGLEYSRVGRFLAGLQGAVTLPYDCSKKENCPNLGPFDLVYSIEVAEHIPASLEEMFIDYICSQGRLVIFSAAQPGQGGHGHINERPSVYWQTMFEQRSFDYIADKTARFSSRLEALGFRGWLPRNCRIFQRLQ